MARYYFDTHDGDHSIVDLDGLDCSSNQQVQHQAVDALPDMARELLPDGPNRLFRVEVRDAGGKQVFCATLELRSRWIEHES